MTETVQMARRLLLHWGVFPIASSIVRNVDSVGTLIGRQLVEQGFVPEGALVVLASVSADLGRCFQLMETDDITLFQRWIADWQDVVEFEVVPVVEGKTTREALTPLL